MSHFKHGGFWHMLYWHMSDKAYWLAPLWRPLCWKNGHEPEPNYDGFCIICRKDMPEWNCHLTSFTKRGGGS